MKLLLITNLYPPKFLGGYELGCSQMADALAAAGHDVRVATSATTSAVKPSHYAIHRALELQPIYSEARLDGLPASVGRYFHQLAGGVHTHNVCALGAIIDAFEPDVVYLWNLLGLGALGVLALLQHQGVPWVWHLMDQIPRQMFRFANETPRLTNELDRVFPGSYIVCSNRVLGEIRLGGVDLGDRVHVLPNWLSGTEQARRTSFYERGVLHIMSASAMLCEEKGTRIMIEVAADLRSRGLVGFTMDLYGRETDPRFRAMLHKHRVADAVRFMGPRAHDEILSLYRSYDVFAFPTLPRDPFPFVALESAAAGCVPLITQDCGAAEWMIGDVDCLKAPRSSSGFAAVIARVLDGEINLGGIGRRAQAVVSREFHISRVIAQVEHILRDAATRRRPPRGDLSEFFDLARFAEALTHVLVEEAQI
jgi:glycosyltransferase involved in cell wall biosynthesis